uniref:Protein kinase domain-containing protein n=1 Tax=Kalanchoe fedtschenkoi TaxID=63787 RepID=A0A7N0RE22_KALFE
MEQFRQIGEVLGSLKALIALTEDIRMNKKQCFLLFDMFRLAYKTIVGEVKENLKSEEKHIKWKALEQPLKELHRVFKEGELYIRYCLECKDFLGKALCLHQNKDCVEFHIHNLLCCFAVVIESIETAGEISGLDQDGMMKRRTVLEKKYERGWNEPKLFQYGFGRQYLVSREMCHRMDQVFREDCSVLIEKIREKVSGAADLSKSELTIAQMLLKKLTGEPVQLLPFSILVGSKDYQPKRRIGGQSNFKEIQWFGECFSLRNFFGEIEPLNTEISSLSRLTHPNIAQYICGFHDAEKKELFLVTEQVTKDLSSHIKEVCGPKRRTPFSVPVAVDIMLQIARGMEYLHSLKIYHGDLKPSNIFLRARNTSTEPHYHVKVYGFGLSLSKCSQSPRSSPNQEETKTNPFIWYAPEVLTDELAQPGGNCAPKCTEKADVYSFGMLCFELLTGKVPFEDGHLQGDKMGRNIRAGERPLFPFPSPKYLVNLTKKCWQTDPLQRPSFSSICRILRYVKRFLFMNPNYIQPELLQPFVDFWDSEVVFCKTFSKEGGGCVGLTSVSQIPFQIFSYRVVEKDKSLMTAISSSKDKASDAASEKEKMSVKWETMSERVPACADDLDNILEDPILPPQNETRSVCSEFKPKSTIARTRSAITSKPRSLLTSSSPGFQTQKSSPLNPTRIRWASPGKHASMPSRVERPTKPAFLSDSEHQYSQSWSGPPSQSPWDVKMAKDSVRSTRLNRENTCRRQSHIWKEGPLLGKGLRPRRQSLVWKESLRK